MSGVLHPGRCVDVMEETMGLMEDGDFLMGGPYNVLWREYRRN